MKYVIITIMTLVVSCSVTPEIDYSKAIIVNEFMVSNKIIKDPIGKTPDWVELYNLTDDAINLGDYYLSDSPTKPTKFKLPDTLLPPRSHYLLWATEKQTGHTNYTGFSFSASNTNKTEYIILYHAELGIIDSIDYIPIPDATKNDKSYGRIPDGAERWGQQRYPTPNNINKG